MSVNATSETVRMPPPAGQEPRSELLRLLARLRSGYERLAAGGGEAGLDAFIAERRAGELMLAEACVRLADAADRPPQVVVVGPTQVGKSTVVNLLLGSEAAVVGPLAGLTVHAQGFIADGESQNASWADALLPGFERVAVSDLGRDRLAAFALEPVRVAPGGGLAGCVIWDTPDFDSLAARRYQRAVLEPVALADVLVVVLSKEKYSDLSAWEILRLVAPLRRSVVLCLNKLPAAAEPVVVGSLRQRLAEYAAELRDAPLVTLPYCGPAAAEWEQLARAAEPLRAAVRRQLAALDRTDRRAGAARLLRAHWDAWLEPARQIEAAAAEWDRTVDGALDELVESYRRDFLDHPQRYDSFRRVAAELLTLLELPGVGPALSRVRHYVTWPVRKLVSAGRSWLGGSRPAGQQGPARVEHAMLEESIDRLLTRLRRDALRQGDESGGAVVFWRGLSRRLERDEPALRQQFSAAIAEHIERVDAEIRRAAAALYEQLRSRPALLNSLRAGRLTADLAGVALAIKTGGLSYHDVLLAPALLAFTSLLAEGALGGYMRREIDELRRRQMREVRERLVAGRMVGALRAPARSLDEPDLMRVDPARLAAAEAELTSWMAGHDRG